MSRYVFKMPDLGEGTVEAEIVACHVREGDQVTEEQTILEVMTEKASVEIPSPVTGRVLSVSGVPGQSIPIGAELIVFETEAPTPEPEASTSDSPSPSRVMASPATRRRAREAGVDLAKVDGSGPGGRITRDDFESLLSTNPVVASVPAHAEVDEIPVIGLRRLIAQRMADAKRTIPHFSYVEEIDVTELEALRQHLNAERDPNTPSFSYLPFIALALARVLPAHPQCNARHDADRNVVVRHRLLHLGIATQTPDGLKVPVLRNVNGHSLASVAAEIRRVCGAARDGTAKRDELSGSTLTITSLGKLGGMATTPIINAPEVAIIGVNKAVERPAARRGALVIRRMMNLSSSFDHRFVDGHGAAAMIQALKDCLERPATIFMERGADR